METAADGVSDVTLAYVLTSVGNPLYDGSHWTGSTYRTFGQQAFVFDFLSRCRRRGLRTVLYVDDPDLFGDARLGSSVPVRDWDALRQDAAGLGGYVLDLPCHLDVDLLPHGRPVIGLLHHAAADIRTSVVERIDSLVCMTDFAAANARRRHPGCDVRLAPQGIDLDRFRVDPDRVPRQVDRVLWHSRVTADKAAHVGPVLAELVAHGFAVDITSEPPSPAVRAKLPPANYLGYVEHDRVPECLADYRLVVSSGRGVMETLAVGRPVICVGFGYGGIPTHASIPALFARNFTGAGMPFDPADLARTLPGALAAAPSHWRGLAERHFDLDMLLNSCTEALTAPAA